MVSSDTYGNNYVMNSENKESRTTPDASISSGSSPTVESSQATITTATVEESDFTEAPLVGICPKPMHEMSDSELREFVTFVRQNRQSVQTFRASVNAATTKRKVPRVLEGFEELL